MSGFKTIFQPLGNPEKKN